MVIITRSKSSRLNISIIAEVREYFGNLIKPLVINKSLEKLFYKLKEGIISKFKDKLREQYLKIQENVFKKLEIISNDNEQYSRRSCLHIHAIEFKGDSCDVMEEIEKCYNVMGIPFNENEIDRAHGIRNPFLDKERKKKIRSIVVKFKSWKVRAAFYKARPKNYVNERKKPGLTSFSVSLDLTKRRYSLLAKAKSIIKKILGNVCFR